MEPYLEPYKIMTRLRQKQFVNKILEYYQRDKRIILRICLDMRKLPAVYVNTMLKRKLFFKEVTRALKKCGFQDDVMLNYRKKLKRYGRKHMASWGFLIESETKRR